MNYWTFLDYKKCRGSLSHLMNPLAETKRSRDTPKMKYMDKKNKSHT